MASIIDSNSTPWIDYGSYATYHSLSSLSIHDPELWMDIVDFALDDLHTNYVFSGDEYPLQLEFETSRQEKQRKIIVKEWGRALKDWQVTAEQKANILTVLFYAIWSKDFAASRTSSVEPSDTSWYAASLDACEAESSTVSTKSGRTYPNRGISFQQETGNERIRPDIQPKKILQYLLQKAVEKHGKRYSDWLEEHPDAEEALSSVLRDRLTVQPGLCLFKVNRWTRSRGTSWKLGAR
jgi:hypothetical protein